MSSKIKMTKEQKDVFDEALAEARHEKKANKAKSEFLSNMRFV